MAGESLHSNAVIHQVNSERRRSYRRGFVATECFWTLSFPFPDPRRVRDEVWAASEEADSNTVPVQRNTAEICLKEIL